MGEVPKNKLRLAGALASSSAAPSRINAAASKCGAFGRSTSRYADLDKPSNRALMSMSDVHLRADKSFRAPVQMYGGVLLHAMKEAVRPRTRQFGTVDA